MDSIPVLSQFKSLAQFIAGDAEGAKKTQEHFRDTAPVVSQVTSLVQEIEGDDAGALETQKKFVKAMDDMTDGTPVIGHIKAGVYYAIGDSEKGDEVMKEATGTLVSDVAFVAGTVVGGPVGGAFSAVASKQIYNGVVTAIDTANKGLKKDGSPQYYGSWKTYDRIGKGKAGAGEIFDAVTGDVEVLGKAIKAKASVRKTSSNTLPSRSGPGIRCKRDTEFNLTPNEFKLITNQQALPGSVNEMVTKDLSSLGVPDTISSIMSIVLILKLIKWNDRRGRTYSWELCSINSNREEIERCQLALMATLRKMENHFTGHKDYTSAVMYPNFKNTNASDIMIKTVATLYGILRMNGSEDNNSNWARELCMYKTPEKYKVCEETILNELMEFQAKCNRLRQKCVRRIKRSCS